MLSIVIDHGQEQEFYVFNNEQGNRHWGEYKIYYPKG